jgi:hypothetical protein
MTIKIAIFLFLAVKLELDFPYRLLDKLVGEARNPASDLPAGFLQI